MGYTIVYGVDKERARSSGRRLLLTGGAFCLFCWAVFSFWPQGARTLDTILFPGDPEGLRAAGEALVCALRSGANLPEAVQTFCQTVIGNG